MRTPTGRGRRPRARGGVGGGTAPRVTRSGWAPAGVGARGCGYRWRSVSRRRTRVGGVCTGAVCGHEKTNRGGFLPLCRRTRGAGGPLLGRVGTAGALGWRHRGCLPPAAEGQRVGVICGGMAPAACKHPTGCVGRRTVSPAVRNHPTDNGGGELHVRGTMTMLPTPNE
ncbi:hypothetical protein BU14_0112s0030 [Porphyra umbilicalis]|uniref:Uncharacterized protein n=1 Tax=Porphyra umbilicalis TaxID=2786 RepID=A0A1X6PBR8_PORUM|nr:hypothetical protein BU14_0112s0030 [Porphyra umbilicalis]|eukprot:OSX78331.1 hypothetical protein BU14_0112s0030 [Porphyra umbilicalis]